MCVCVPAVKRLHDEVQQLAQCHSNGFMRGGVEGWHLLHDALCMLPVSDLQQRLEQAQFLVIGRLEGEKGGEEVLRYYVLVLRPTSSVHGLKRELEASVRSTQLAPCSHTHTHTHTVQ